MSHFVSDKTVLKYLGMLYPTNFGIIWLEIEKKAMGASILLLFLLVLLQLTTRSLQKIDLHCACDSEASVNRFL